MSTTIAPKAATSIASVPTDRHPAAVYLARLAPGSRRTMRHALETIADLVSRGTRDASSLDWGGLRYQHTAAIRSVLAERFRPATANKMLSALRGVLKEAWRLGAIDGGEYQRAIDIPAVRGSAIPRGRALRRAELRDLFAVCRSDPHRAGARDAAMIALLYGTGLRRTELAELDLDDYSASESSLAIRSGKGAKGRVVYVGSGATAALAEWLAARGTRNGPLFMPLNKAGVMVHRRMTDQAVFNMLKKRGGQAQLETFSPHDLRRTFISDLLDSGADISAVQQLAGHANIQTTVGYDRRGERAKRRAAALIDVPYAVTES